MLNKKSVWVQLLVLLLLTIGGMLVSTSLSELIILLIYKTPSLLEASDPATAIRISQSIITPGTFLFPALMFAFSYERKWFNFSLANRKPPYVMVNVMLLISITILPVVALLSSFNQSIMPQEGSIVEWMKSTEENAALILKIITSQRSSWALISNLMVVAVLAGVCEEFFFQGTLQQIFTRSIGNPHVAIFLTALIFSAIHFQFYGFIPRFVLGVYMGYLFYWSRSLWLPVLAHVLHNALTILVDYTLQGRDIDTDAIQFSQIRGAIPLAATCTLVTIMGIVFLWRTHKELNL